MAMISMAKRATEAMMLAKSNGGELQRNSGELIWI